MARKEETSFGCTLPSFGYMLPGLLTAMIGHHIHASLFWALADFFFWPLAWMKWLVCHQVSYTVIRETFEFIFR